MNPYKAPHHRYHSTPHPFPTSTCKHICSNSSRDLFYLRPRNSFPSPGQRGGSFSEEPQDGGDPDSCHTPSEVVYSIKIYRSLLYMSFFGGYNGRALSLVVLPGYKEIEISTFTRPTPRWPLKVGHRQPMPQDIPRFPPSKRPSQRPPTRCATQPRLMICQIANEPQYKKKGFCRIITRELFSSGISRFWAILPKYSV